MACPGQRTGHQVWEHLLIPLPLRNGMAYGMSPGHTAKVERWTKSAEKEKRLWGAGVGGRRMRLSARIWQGCACRTSWVAPPAEQGRGRAMAAAASLRTTSTWLSRYPLLPGDCCPCQGWGRSRQQGQEGNQALLSPHVPVGLPRRD